MRKWNRPWRGFRLPANTLPEDVQPALGPDATRLGQVFWYTLEGRDERGQPTGGWDLQELRSIQDWQVRYALMAADGVSEDLAHEVGGVDAVPGVALAVVDVALNPAHGRNPVGHDADHPAPLAAL